MWLAIRSPLALLFLLILRLPGASADESKGVIASVESSLTTATTHIRQFTFDGDAETYFASAENPKTTDSVTLRFDKPLTLKDLKVTTGRPDGTDKLDSASLQVSADGKEFEEIARFVDGSAEFKASERSVQAIRIKPTADLTHPLVIREIEIEATEPVVKFRYPVEFVVNVTDAPEMKEWADKVAKLCEEWYPRINDELKSDGFKPATQITLTLRSSYDGVAEASGNRITGSVKYFKAKPKDFGAMIHETCHVVQRYQGRRNPGWLVEGVADYVRFFVYEPGKAGPVNPQLAHYNDSYRTSASFLDFVSTKYDKAIVLKLNKLMREGKYKADVFKEMTGKTLKELDEEWLESLNK